MSQESYTELTVLYGKTKTERDELLGATKFALRHIAELNAGGGIETAKQLKIAQQKLFNAVKAADPQYYGIK